MTTENTSWKRAIGMALLVTLISGMILTSLTIWLDHTNYGTQNGMWKAVMIREYNQTQIDYKHLSDLTYITNMCYFPVYGFIIQHWPSSWETSIIQKMSIINSWFGAISLGFFFLLIFLLTHSFFVSIAAGIFHLSSGTFLSVTTGSEDIIPAYSMFVAFVFFFLLYLQKGSRKWLLLSALFFGFSWLFHWTMAIGATPAIAVAVLVFHKNRKLFIRDMLRFASVNIFLIIAASLITGSYIAEIIMPGKGMDSGYLGFTTEKFILLYTGFVQYILGGFQFNGVEQLYDQLFVYDWYQPAFIASSVIFFIMVAYGIYFFTKNKRHPWLVPFGFFLIVLFVFAQLMNAYEFGTDLQFHLQPMIWLPITYGLASNQLLSFHFRKLSSVGKGLAKIFIALALLAIPLGLLEYNIAFFRLPNQGLDSFYLREIKKVEPYFLKNLDNTIFVTRGWDEFGNWGYMEWGPTFRKNCIRVSDFLENEPNESIEAACNRMEQMVTEAIQQGKVVVTGMEIIDRDETEIVNIFSGFGQNEKAYALIRTVRKKFDRELLVETEMGSIYKLKLKKSAAN